MLESARHLTAPSLNDGVNGSMFCSIAVHSSDCVWCHPSRTNAVNACIGSSPRASSRQTRSQCQEHMADMAVTPIYTDASNKPTTNHRRTPDRGATTRRQAQRVAQQQSQRQRQQRAAQPPITENKLIEKQQDQGEPCGRTPNRKNGTGRISKGTVRFIYGG